MADNGPDTMATHLGLVVWVVVAAALLQCTVSEHKKKIIVKVPTIIKHHHHEHYKPYHVHKVHSKQVEHHHHREEKKVKKVETQVKKPKGSFSHLRPVLLHQDVEEFMEYPRDHRQELKYDYGKGNHGQDDYADEVKYGYGTGYGRNSKNGYRKSYNDMLRSGIGKDYNRGLDYDYGKAYGQGFQYGMGLESGYGKPLTPSYVNDYSHELGYGPRNNYGYEHQYAPKDEWNSENVPEKRRNKHNGGGVHQEHGKWSPIDLPDSLKGGSSKTEIGGDEWLISSEDLRELKESQGFFGGNRFSDNTSTKKKQLKWKSPEPEDNGWKPMMDFSGWKDVDDIGNNRDELYNSGEDQSVESNEYVYDDGLDNSHKKKKKSRKNKKNNTKWSKEISEQDREGGPDTLSSQHQPLPSQRPIQQQLNHYQVERPLPLIARAPPQFIQALQINPQPAQQPLPQHLQVMWTQQSGVQQQTPKPWPQQQQQQWPPPQAAAQNHNHRSTQPAHSRPPHQVQVPTSSPKVIWSGHHLQMPQHTMWHVQQHSVQAVPVHPVQPMNVVSHTLPVVPARQLQLLPIHQQQSSQLPQATVPVHQVVPPEWTATQTPVNHPAPIRQHWESSVRMGNASAYKVEVFNYVDQNQNKQK